jgi:hypothetical protein
VILPIDQQQFLAAQLSPPAARLYFKIKQYLEHRNLTKSWLYDAEAARRGGLSLAELPAAQREVATSGLLILTAGAVQIRYELPGEETYT